MVTFGEGREVGGDGGVARQQRHPLHRLVHRHRARLLVGGGAPRRHHLPG